MCTTGYKVGRTKMVIKAAAADTNGGDNDGRKHLMEGADDDKDDDGTYHDEFSHMAFSKNDYTVHG